MNRECSLSLLLAVAACFCWSPLQAQQGQKQQGSKQTATQQLRILCYNIHHGEGVDKQLDLKRIAKLIKKTDADIVALQEVDFKTSRTDRVDQAQVLANLTQMKFVFGPNIEFGGGKYGNAILSKHPIASSTNRKLPNLNNGEQRGLLGAIIQPKGIPPIHFYSTHFDHRQDDSERVASAEFVNREIEPADAHLTLMAGDFNATIGSRPLKILEQKWVRSNGTELPTVPVVNPKRQIDFIMMPIGQKLTCLKTQVLPEAIASDHRAVLAVFAIK